mmetsp:Transcript_14151/g.39446  ORF Transcript_14151/g.39446 Transcript_14151/m.39446 type:complete len:203 (-) Transcript_14151:1443-2051(-)
MAAGDADVRPAGTSGPPGHGASGHGTPSGPAAGLPPGVPARCNVTRIRWRRWRRQRPIADAAVPWRWLQRRPVRRRRRQQRRPRTAGGAAAGGRRRRQVAGPYAQRSDRGPGTDGAGREDQVPPSPEAEEGVQVLQEASGCPRGGPAAKPEEPRRAAQSGGAEAKARPGHLGGARRHRARWTLGIGQPQDVRLRWPDADAHR